MKQRNAPSATNYQPLQQIQSAEFGTEARSGEEVTAMLQLPTERGYNEQLPIKIQMTQITPTQPYYVAKRDSTSNSR